MMQSGALALPPHSGGLRSGTAAAPTAQTGSSITSKCLAGGIGCSVAGFLTNPCDVIKVRNQQFADAKYRTFRSTASAILREEKFVGFFKGAHATVVRECTYSSVRMGLYEPIKFAYARGFGNGDANAPIVKLLSSFTSGALGSALFNPIDVVKIRFQSASGPPPFSSLQNAFHTIYAEKGLGGLYRGTSATVTRAAFLNAAELGTYDIIKNNVMVSTLEFEKEANGTHLLASFVASLITTTVANPADVVKTRVINDPHGAIGGAGAHFRHVLETEGPMGFLRGWTASYMRMGPHTMISLMVIEKVRQMVGMGSY